MENLRGVGYARWLGAAAIAVSLLYAWQFVFRGWIPHDEGLLGQSAERVLAGEIPHIDFDDPYTGGLSWFHALAFKLLGVRLSSIRIALFLSFALTLPLINALARRIAPPMVAAFVVLACTVWSVPNYFAGLPSWYNLFFAIAALWCLVRFDENGRKRWLSAGGAAMGLSFLIKISGLYPLAAGLLYLAFRGIPASEPGGAERREESGTQSRAGLGFLWLVAAGIVLALIALVRTTLSGMVVLHFVLPGTLLAVVVVWRAWLARDHVELGVRTAATMRLQFLLVASFAAPIAFFLSVYAMRGGLGAWFRGVCVLPQTRLTGVTYPLPPALSLVGAALIAGLFLGAGRWRRTPRGTPIFVAIAAVVTLLALGGKNVYLYTVVWASLRPLVPLATIALALRMLRDGPRQGGARPAEASLFLVVAFAAFASLIQFPYAFGIYFCYAAPLVILAWMYLGSDNGRVDRRYVAFLACYALFAALWLNRGWIRTMGAYYRPVANDTLLLPGRGNLRVPRADAERYARIVSLVETHAGPSPYIWAGPDAPEVYFLSGRRNPTRSLYEVFDASPDQARRILDLTDRHRIGAVVINTRPEFTPLERGLYSGLQSRYPAGRAVGPFHIRWKREPQ